MVGEGVAVRGQEGEVAVVVCVRGDRGVCGDVPGDDLPGGTCGRWMMAPKYLRPVDIKPGDIVYEEDGSAHVVEFVVGNMIATTDGKVEIIPPTDDELEE